VGTFFVSHGNGVGMGMGMGMGDDENGDSWNGDIYLSPCSFLVT